MSESKMTPQERWEDFQYRHNLELKMAPLRNRFENALSEYRENRQKRGEGFDIFFFDGQ